MNYLLGTLEKKTKMKRKKNLGEISNKKKLVFFKISFTIITFK